MIEEPFIGGALGISFSLAGLSELRNYHETVERVFEETSNWRLASIDKKAKSLPAEKQEYFRDLNHPYSWLLSFPSQLRATIVISGMSFFESQLWEVTRSAQYRSQIEFEKPKKNILSSYRNYLKNTGGLDIENNNEWKTINKLYLLRNVLVHNGMYLGGKDDESSSIIEDVRASVEGLSFDKEGYYFLEKRLCTQMFNCIEEWLNQLKDEVGIKWKLI